MRQLSFRSNALLLALGAVLAMGRPAAADPTVAQRAQAVRDTIDQSNTCSTCTLGSYYWEIGDKDGVLASGSVTDPAAVAVAADTVLKIASASKWLFAAYLVERNSGALSPDDLQALTMKTGYTNFKYSACGADTTVETCFEAPHLLLGSNNDFSRRNLDKFYYNGGHFQKRAVAIGLGGLTNEGLQAEYTRYLTGFDFEFDRPQLAAGMKMTGAQYGVFLRKLLDGSLILGSRLGEEAVCTKRNWRTCRDVGWGRSSPAPDNWHYSLGHWVEDNTNLRGATVGDGAYSSPGAFGFYPWIDHGRVFYGILAREDHRRKAYVRSAECGQKLRAAWETATPQQ